MKETSKKSVAMYGVVQASKVIGEMVVDHKDEKVGKIHELVIDAIKNRAAYAVLSFGGFLGMGNKLFAMPWEAFEFSATENKLILNVDKEKWKMQRFSICLAWTLPNTVSEECRPCDDDYAMRSENR